MESDLLVHFNPSKEGVLSCDTSPYGLGAVISHVIDGIRCASCTLSQAEKQYSLLEEEALAAVEAFLLLLLEEYCVGL